MGIQSPLTVEIVFGEQGACEAAQRRAVTIVVDALRASATTVTALALGAAGVLPVLTVEEAATYVGRTRHRVAGERQGAKCPGFDHGNSPTELQHEQRQLAGNTLVLSTSNGTKMVNAARDGAEAVLMGTTLNARAVAEAAHALAARTARPILLVAAGEYGQPAEEDECAARTIARHLAALGAEVPLAAVRDECTLSIFEATPSADELRGLGYDKDIAFCAQVDLFDIAPLLKGARFVPYRDEPLSVAVA